MVFPIKNWLQSHSWLFPSSRQGPHAYPGTSKWMLMGKELYFHVWRTPPHLSLSLLFTPASYLAIHLYSHRSSTIRIPQAKNPGVNWLPFCILSTQFLEMHQLVSTFRTFTKYFQNLPLNPMITSLVQVTTLFALLEYSLYCVSFVVYSPALPFTIW